jgi:hypothetical protein
MMEDTRNNNVAALEGNDKALLGESNLLIAANNRL